MAQLMGLLNAYLTTEICIFSHYFVWHLPISVKMHSRSWVSHPPADMY